MYYSDYFANQISLTISQTRFLLHSAGLYYSGKQNLFDGFWLSFFTNNLIDFINEGSIIAFSLQLDLKSKQHIYNAIPDVFSELSAARGLVN